MATSAAISERRRRAPCGVAARASGRRPPRTSARAADNAGATPVMTTERIPAAAANRNTAPLVRTSPSRGMSAGASRTSSPASQVPSSEARADAAERQHARFDRALPGQRPRAGAQRERTAISRRRAVARANRRFATLAQPISSTPPTAAISASSAGLASAESEPASGSMVAVHPALLAGCSDASCADRPSSSRRASPTVTAGARRAITSKDTLRRCAAGIDRSGTPVHASVPSGNAKPRGITPTISRGSRPSIITRRPTTSAAPPNARCQSP